MSSRLHDIVILGATGFTGRLVAEYFAQNVPLKGRGSVQWAIGGRNLEKLTTVRDKLVNLNDACLQVPLVKVDVNNANEVEEMAKSTRVVINMAGPFNRYGSNVVAACVHAQTHYCDITGEANWVRKMIDLHHEQASKNGTFIVPCCGFDSIPSDIGAYLAVQQAKAKISGMKEDPSSSSSSSSSSSLAVGTVTGAYAVQGGLSGGTIQSILDVMASPELREMSHPFYLNRRRENGTGYIVDSAKSPVDADVMSWSYQKAQKEWHFPFLMAGVNTRVVRRSVSLNPSLYGNDFHYREVMRTRSGLTAVISTLVMGLAVLLLWWPLSRALLRTVLPAAGSGPSEKQREKGKFTAIFRVQSAEGRGTSLGAVKVSGADPGYGATSGMVANCGLLLLAKAKEGNLSASSSASSVGSGGVLTPATAFGDDLVRGLEASKVLSFEVMSSD